MYMALEKSLSNEGVDGGYFTPTSVHNETEDSPRGSLVVRTMEDVDNVQARGRATRFRYVGWVLVLGIHE